VPAFIDNAYRTIKNRESRFLAGFSMGGYGAVSLLCRYPEIFSVALNRAGVMNLATGIEDLDWDDTGTLSSILGTYWKNREGYHLNGCFNLVNKLKDRKDVAIVVEVGREDFLYTTNNKFRSKLEQINIPYIYAEYPGGHVWSSNCFMSMLTHLQFFKKTI
jgi:enterochelin esterase-like enzyme